MAELEVFAPDLMDRSKIVAAAPHATVVQAVTDLGGGPGVTVVLDLSRPGAAGAVGPLVAGGARVLAFGSHVERGVLEAAGAAGAEAMPRSAFFGRLAQLLGPASAG